jgi:hypothetical protein
LVEKPTVEPTGWPLAARRHRLGEAAELTDGDVEEAFAGAQTACEGGVTAVWKSKPAKQQIHRRQGIDAPGAEGVVREDVSVDAAADLRGGGGMQGALADDVLEQVDVAGRRRNRGDQETDETGDVRPGHRGARQRGIPPPGIEERTPLPGAAMSGFIRFEPSTVTGPRLEKLEAASLEVVEPTEKTAS